MGKSLLRDDARAAGGTFAWPAPVLIVEDSASDAHLIREELVDLGWDRSDVHTAASLQAAREAVLQAAFGVILLDLSLPDAAGLEGVSVLAAAAPDVPIVVVTANEGDSMALAALSEGADEFVAKGALVPAELAGAVRRASSRRGGKRSSDVTPPHFEALDAPTVVLDGFGRIVSSNTAWKDAARAAGAAPSSIGTGVNYLAVCDHAVGLFSEGAAEAGAGIRSVLAGRAKDFGLDYPCPSVDGTDRWFSMRVTSLGRSGGGAIVTHLDITPLKVAERQLQSHAAIVAGSVDETFPILAVVDEAGTIRHLSAATAEVLGLRVGDELGASGFARIHERDVEAAQAALRFALDHPGEQRGIVVSARDGLGSWRELDLVVVNLLHDDRVAGILVTGSDITAARRAQIAGRLQARLLDRLPAAVIVTDERGVVVYWNERAASIYGFAPSEALGRPIAALNIGPEDVAQADAMLAQVVAGKRWEGDYDARRADGSIVPIYATLEVISDPEIGFRGVVGASVDISERRRLEANLAFGALHDPLTGLPNRRLFVDHLESALARGARHGTTIAVLYIDIDHFKDVNDRAGHAAGDEVLRTVSAYLEGLVPSGDLVARLGGDEFVVCCADVESPTQAVAVAEALLQALRAPFRLDTQEFVVSASIGVALSTPASHPDDLIRRADAAMYQAKEAGRNRVELFDDELHDLVRQRRQMAIELDAALVRGELEVHYQPEIHVASGMLAGFEALVRWRHPQRGMVPPDEFIGVAEESGLIKRLGLVVLEQVCGALGTWLETMPERTLTVSVNVSAKQLTDPDFPAAVEATLAAGGIPAAHICLEVTETALLDPEAAGVALRRLKAVGVSIAIDDFGTGYSSLSRLKRLPVDFLKIDRSFVGGIGRDPEDDVIVESVVSLAHSLGLEVVAEGVETEAQLQRLADLGCELGQGYLWERPVDLASATLLVAERQGGWSCAAAAEHALGPAVDDAEPIDARAAVALLAHELAAPLTSLAGYAELLIELEDPVDRAKAVRAVARNSRLARSALSLVSDVAALDDGRLRLYLEELDLRDVVDDALDLVRARNGPEVHFDLDVPSIRTNGDADRLVGAVSNLMANARKYSPVGEPVQVWCEVTNDRVSLHVSDAGPGVPSDRVGLIFRKFGRADRQRAGTGLGLFLARGIARAHGGELSYRRSRRGGAEFVLELPGGDAAAHA